MSYIVFARKYRPQTFDEVIKQEHVSKTLANAISSNRVSHAILLSGPRGTGKTTVARILAKAMNCKKGPAPVPCNSCRSCTEITSGSSADVLEIDGASNNGVEQIRTLRENVKYMPAYSLYKIYIIDEVHMLSVAAFNALLKTLEEPPEHIMFIFATTEPHKIPITILSRCQRYDFRRIDVESLSKHMEMICTKEGVDISIESLSIIARVAGGSMRDALSLLDQVISCAQGPVTHEQVLDILSVIDRKKIYDISEAILNGDVAGILCILDEIYNRGYEMKRLYSDLVEHFRNLIIVKMGKDVKKLVDLPAHEIDLAQEQVKDVSAVYLNQILNLLFKEEPAIRFSAQPKLALEMIFIKMFQIKPAMPIDLLIEKLDSMKNEVYEKQGNEIFEHQLPYGDYNKRAAVQDDGKDLRASSGMSKETEGSNEPVAAACLDDARDHEGTWKKLLDVFLKNYPSLAANLTRCTLKKMTDQGLEIEVNGNGFNLKMLRRSKNMTIIKKVCEDFFGKKMDFAITEKKKQRAESKSKKTGEEGLKKEALSHRLVADAVEIFNGNVVDVKIL